MSSTRRSNDPDKVSYGKYMSSPEFVAMRPIPGNLVLPKALLYADAKIRELAFFLQAMSMQNGGMRAVAEQLVAWFPERCREDDSQEARVLRFVASVSDRDIADVEREVLQARTLGNRTVSLLSEFLAELILNPKLSLSKIQAPCFWDLGSALAHYKAVHEKAALDGFVVTTIGKPVHKTLDKALNLSRMVVVEGPAGVGKSTNTKVWCAARPGLVRYVSLTGATTRTLLFQKIGSAIGLATCQRKAHQLQVKIEDFFVRTKMMLVIDEAHYLWPQALRTSGVPELIDWIDTALVNNQVPVALLCTDQFARLKSKVERLTGWTSEQFIHRVFRYHKTEATPTREDVESVASAMLSSTWEEDRQKWIVGSAVFNADFIDALVRYAMEQKMPLSCVSSCIHEARGFARERGSAVVSKADAARALGHGQIPSDTALGRAFNPPPLERYSRRAVVAPGSTTKPRKTFVSRQPSNDSEITIRHQNKTVLSASPIASAETAPSR